MSNEGNETCRWGWRAVKYHRVYQEPPAISDSGIQHPAFPSNDSKHPSQDGSQASSSEVLKKSTLPEFWSPEEINSTSQISYSRISSDSLWKSRWTGEGQDSSPSQQLWSSEEFISTNQINLTIVFIVENPPRVYQAPPAISDSEKGGKRWKTLQVYSLWKSVWSERSPEETFNNSHSWSWINWRFITRKKVKNLTIVFIVEKCLVGKITWGDIQ